MKIARKIAKRSMALLIAVMLCAGLLNLTVLPASASPAGEQFSIMVNYGYTEGDNGDNFVILGRQTVNSTCIDSSEHSEKHFMDARAIAEEAGYSGSVYVTTDGTWKKPADTTATTAWTEVNYDTTTGKAKQTIWVAGSKPAVDTRPQYSSHDSVPAPESGKKTIIGPTGGTHTWQQSITYHSNYPDGSCYEYTVTYDFQQSNIDEGLNDQLESLENVEFSIPEGYCIPQETDNEGKQLVWNTQRDGKGASSYGNGGSYPFSEGANGTTIDLYAQWVPIPYTYTLKYNAKGGTVLGKSVYESTVETTDKSYGFLSIEPDELTGYTFEGWYEDEGLTTRVNWDNGKTLNKPVSETETEVEATVYAKWNKLPDTYKASYKVQWIDATDAEEGILNTDDSRTGIVGETVEVTDEDKSYEGYTYVGDNDNRNKLSDKLAASGTVLKLYFTKNAPTTWIVKFYNNTTGTFGEAKLEDTQTVPNNSTVTAPIVSNEKCPFFTFDGWYVVGDSAQYDFSTPVTSDLTLVAEWSATDGKITGQLPDISVDVTCEDHDPKTYKLTDNDFYTVTQTKASSDGSAEAKLTINVDKYVEHYGETNGTHSLVSSANTVINLVKTAGSDQWTLANGQDGTATISVKCVTWTVTFDPNNRSDTTSQTVKDGEKAIRPDDPTHEDTGLEFAGWYTDNNELYYFDAPVKGDITLTAKWTIKNDPGLDPDMGVDASCNCGNDDCQCGDDCPHGDGCNCGNTEEPGEGKEPEQPKHTHSYTSSVTKPATCTEAGERTYTCECGEFYTETIPATGHRYGAWQNAGDDHYRVCQNDSSHVQRAAHSYGDWTVRTPATAEAAGVEYHACGICGHEETRPIEKLTEEDPTEPEEPGDDPTEPEDPADPDDGDIEIPEDDTPLGDLPDIEIPEEDPPLGDLPGIDIPEEDPPLSDLPDIEIPEEDPPLSDLPDIEIPEEDPPLSNLPDIDIPEEDPPLADVPETGDHSHIWGYFALISGAGLAMLALTARKREEDAG